MKLIFFSKCTKFNVDSKNAIKAAEKVQGFCANDVTKIYMSGSERVTKHS